MKPLFLLRLAALIAISFLYRADLALKRLVIYWSIWLLALTAAVLLHLPPGYFVACQAALAVAMLIQLGVNPEI